MLMIVLDATIVSVALPVIQDDLDFSPSSLAYLPVTEGEFGPAEPAFSSEAA